MTLSFENNARYVNKDEVLFKEGQEPTQLILVKSGAVLCVKRSKERIIPVGWVTNQQILGEEAILTGTEHIYSAVVMEPSEIVEIDVETIKRTISSAPSWIGGLMGTLGERAGDTSSAIAEHRIAHPELSGGSELSAQEETRLKKILGLIANKTERPGDG